MQAKEVLAVRVPKQLKHKLALLARAERRSLSNLVEVLLEASLVARQPKEQAV